RSGSGKSARRRTAAPSRARPSAPGSSWQGVAHDAVGPLVADDPAGVVEIVQVRDGLAHGEERLVGIERPAKEDTEQVGGASGPGLQRFEQLGEALLMMRRQLLDARMRAAEGLAMRGKHE